MIYTYDYDRLVAMNTRQIDFGQCVMDLKYGVGAHAVNIFLSALTGLLSLVSACMAVWRTCICGV